MSSAERLDVVLIGYAECSGGGYGGTPAAVAMWLGLDSPRRDRGPWSGPMNPAQRIISATRSLERRGLLHFAQRRDGLSGTAYSPTEAGRAKVAEMRAGADQA